MSTAHPEGTTETGRGRRAVVTGGSHGIGAAVVGLLREAGTDVVVLDREDPRGDPWLVQVDLSDPAATVAEAAAAVVRRFGDVDLLVNCAGVGHSCPVLEPDEAGYRSTLAVNLDAPIVLMREFGREMAARGRGHIVNVTSIHAAVTEPGSLAYDVAKAGLESATRTFAVELAPSGVLVNAVAPGFVSTRMSVVDGQDELDGEEFQEVYVRWQRLPLQRAATPDEVARAIVWLGSPENTYATGQVLTVDGGLTSRF